MDLSAYAIDDLALLGIAAEACIAALGFGSWAIFRSIAEHRFRVRCQRRTVARLAAGVAK